MSSLREHRVEYPALSDLLNKVLVYEGAPGLKVAKSIVLSPERYAGTISGETRALAGGANNAFVTTTPLPLGYRS